MGKKIMSGLGEKLLEEKERTRNLATKSANVDGVSLEGTFAGEIIGFGRMSSVEGK